MRLSKVFIGNFYLTVLTNHSVYEDVQTTLDGLCTGYRYVMDEWKLQWGYSSVVEHLTADQEVPSSNLGAP